MNGKDESEPVDRADGKWGVPARVGDNNNSQDANGVVVIGFHRPAADRPMSG